MNRYTVDDILQPRLQCAGNQIGPVQITLGTPALLNKILNTVYHNSTYGQLLPCLRVCRAFHYWGRKRLYQVLTFTTISLARFLMANKYTRRTTFPVHMLTVRLVLIDELPVFRGISAPTVVLYGDALIHQLAEFMKMHMPFIGSFSIRIEDQVHEGLSPDIPRRLGWISASSIMTLLGALPLSCVDLEVDTSGFEVYRGSEHICPYIRYLIPRLRHVRIRIAKLCSEVLGERDLGQGAAYVNKLRIPLCLKLRSVVINMELYSSIVGGTQYCKGNDDDRCHVVLLRELVTDPTSASNFPKLERLDIYSPVAMDGGANNAIWHCDVKNDKTHVMSYLWVPGFDLQSEQPINWRCIRKHNNEVVVAQFSQARELVEDSWRSTPHGTRFAISRVSRRMLKVFTATYAFNNPITYFRYQRELRRQDDPMVEYISRLDLWQLRSTTHSGIWYLSYHPEGLREWRLVSAGGQ